ncbi:hypothetical protein WA158_001782 [Blastocystis sp. Blastoise]
MNRIQFIFQDESKVSIPLSILNQYSESLLSIVAHNSSSYLEDDHAYFVDAPSLAIDKLIQYMNDKLSIKEMSINVLIDLYKTIEYYFVEDNLYKSKLYDRLTEIFNDFLNRSNYGFTDNSEKLFKKYSKIFDFFNVTTVTSDLIFSDDIRSEEMYPSNLLEIFPKIKKYNLKLSYFPKDQEICIPPSDPHYTLLYKEYKRLYYKNYYPEAYKQYNHDYPQIYSNSLSDTDIHILESNNNGNMKEKNSNKIIIHHEIIPIDIDKEIQNEKEEEKPDLYIVSLSDYSREYDDDQWALEEDDLDLDNLKSTIIEFSFIDDDDNRDILHPILTIPDNTSIDILSYILSIPIYQPRNKLQINIPQLLKAVNDGIIDFPQQLDFYYFVKYGDYPEYIQLFKDLITTRVFPNVTTLVISSADNDTYIMLKDILPLITREHFPNLHIYDITKRPKYTYLDPSENITHYILPISLILLVDTIIVSNDIRDSSMDILNDNVYNNFITAKQSHDFTVEVCLCAEKLTDSWNELCNQGILKVNYMYSDFYNLDKKEYDLSLIDLSRYDYKQFILTIDISQEQPIEMLKNQYSKLLNKNINEIYLLFDYNDDDEKNIYYFNEYFSIFNKENYQSVTNLTIHESILYMDNPRELNDISEKDLNSIYNYFQRFTSNIIELDLKSNYIVLKDLLMSIFSYFKDHKLSTLKSLQISETYMNSRGVDISPIFQFINKFKDSSITLPNLKELQIQFGFYYDDDYALKINVFDSFPSLQYYLHRPVTSIRMIVYSHDSSENFEFYCNYIYEQLKLDYTKNIQVLLLCIDNKTILDNIIHLITVNTYPYLRELFIYITEDTDQNELDHTLSLYKTTYNPQLKYVFYL